MKLETLGFFFEKIALLTWEMKLEKERNLTILSNVRKHKGQYSSSFTSKPSLFFFPM